METWIPIQLKLTTPVARRAFVNAVRGLLRGKSGATRLRVKGWNRRLIETAIPVLVDLRRQGWLLRVRKQTVEIAAPLCDSDRALEKTRVQRQLLIERDDQLREPAVREFISSMERPHLHEEKFVSVFDLMRDGGALAATLSSSAVLAEPSRSEALKQAVKPYLQEVREDEVCARTGFRLVDIWRYFRHTWSKAYRSIPGRSMMFLVRDAAVEPHPVIGITALSSPMVQISVRDAWIGWQPEAFLKMLSADRHPRWLKWIRRALDDAEKALYIDDLIEDELVTMRALRHPDAKTIKALERDAEAKRREHHRFVDSRDHKRGHDDEDDVWAHRSALPLFRSKRAKHLAQLLRARRALAVAMAKRTDKARLDALLDTSDGLKAVRFAIRRTKAARVGVALADLTVCGAVAPYNEILGGKLVAMMMTSPEVIALYKKRYRRSESIIASSMAGRGVVKAPELVVLATTSLYGTGSAQYNRLKMPAPCAGGRGDDAISYDELGVTEGYGTLQFSKPALELIALLVAQREQGQKVNSIFGEGVNPRFRKIRDGLDELGLPSDALLRHGAPRVVYGIALARNFRRYLLGLDARPKYFLPKAKPRERTLQIVSWWRERWLAKRIDSSEVLERVAANKLSLPIRHRARVPLPSLQLDEPAAAPSSSAFRRAPVAEHRRTRLARAWSEMTAVASTRPAIGIAHEEEHRLLDDPRVVALNTAVDLSQVDALSQLKDELTARGVRAKAAIADRRQEEVDVRIDDDKSLPLDTLAPWRTGT